MGEKRPQRVLRARTELRVEVDERAAVVPGDAHKHRGARHRLRDLADLTRVVERHAPHAILRRRAQAARVLHGIRVDHAVARDALARERLDLPRRRHVEFRAERRETAQNGMEALKMFKERTSWYYDIIFMDIRMPELDGYAATREIRALGGRYATSVPIVAMTANAFAEDVAEAARAGMNEHLSKPIEIEKLLSVLDYWLQ